MLKTVFEATVKVRDRPVSDRNAGAAGAGNHTSVSSATYVPFTVLKSEVGWVPTHQAHGSVRSQKGKRHHREQ
jgi:hypothetical protein